MTPLPLKLFNPAATNRVAVVSIEPVHGQAEAFLLRVARGVQAGKLAASAVYGPFAQPELAARIDDVVAALRAEGYGDAEDSALRDLFDTDSAKRGRAAVRLGWRGGPRAADALLVALPKAVDDVCPILDALGAIGDPRAIPDVRLHAARKLLSRRRSAVEALRNLNDVEGLAEARVRTLEGLPANVRDAIAAITDERNVSPAAVASLVAAVKAADAQRHGLCADLLYELASPVVVAAAVQLVSEMSFDRPFVWRYVKSILKRSMLRRDYATWGRLQHAIERQGLAVTKGTKAIVKSGYDGAERETTIFSRRTRDYVRRAGWRYLRQLARYRPDDYAAAAAEAIIHYAPEDERPPRKLYGAFADAYLLNRVLYDGGDRLQFIGRSMKFRFRSAKAAKGAAAQREERFAALWDRQPAAYVRLLAAARLVDVHQFAHRALLRGHMAVVQHAPTNAVLKMLDAPFEPTVELALSELKRRFDPAAPDFALVARLAADARPTARDLGQQFMRDTSDRWTGDVEAVVEFLLSPQPTTRLLAADLTIAALARGDQAANHRRALATRLLDVLRTPSAAGSEEDVLESVARVCREALLDDLASLSTADVLSLLEAASPSAKAVAGDLLGRRPEAADDLGLPRLVMLANHPLAAVRGAAIALLRVSEASWQREPSALFALIDSEWSDVRAAVLDLVRTRLDFTTLGTAGIIGLLDSNRPDVQDLGVELARRHLAQLDAVDLVNRLSEHPHPHARPFALELATAHLPPGAAALSELERFFRTVLLDTRPTAARTPRRNVIALLLSRGLLDAQQAAIVARVLGEVVKFQGRAEFERAMDALVRLKLAHPQADLAGISLPAEPLDTTAPVGGAA
ncbi:MAG TPA: hypothetical protein VGN72_23730 [Tepidisphaeraceae bacterium]|jgi:hypothetical protein|nr:hypothetical protein [Tepidisphaeraceae bacterium]